MLLVPVDFNGLMFHLIVVSYGLPTPPWALPVLLLIVQPVGSLPSNSNASAMGVLFEQHDGELTLLTHLPTVHLSSVQVSLSSQAASVSQQALSSLTQPQVPSLHVGVSQADVHSLAHSIMSHTVFLHATSTLTSSTKMPGNLLPELSPASKVKQILTDLPWNASRLTVIGW